MPLMKSRSKGTQVPQLETSSANPAISQVREQLCMAGFSRVFLSDYELPPAAARALEFLAMLYNADVGIPM